MKALDLSWMIFEDEPLRRETEIVELRMYWAAQGGNAETTDEEGGGMGVRIS